MHFCEHLIDERVANYNKHTVSSSNKITATRLISLVSSLVLLVVRGQSAPLPGGERRRGGHDFEHPRQAGPVHGHDADVAIVHPVGRRRLPRARAVASPLLLRRRAAVERTRRTRTVVRRRRSSFLYRIPQALHSDCNRSEQWKERVRPSPPRCTRDAWRTGMTDSMMNGLCATRKERTEKKMWDRVDTQTWTHLGSPRAVPPQRRRRGVAVGAPPGRRALAGLLHQGGGDADAG